MQIIPGFLPTSRRGLIPEIGRQVSSTSTCKFLFQRLIPCGALAEAVPERRGRNRLASRDIPGPEAEPAYRSRGAMSAPAGPSGMGMLTVTTVMAFSVSAFLVLFVFTRLFCVCIHLRAAAAEHAQPSDAAAFPAIHVERGIRGTEPSVVTTFPTVKFGDDSQRPPAQEESQCTVCLEEYEAKDVVRVLPYCGHAFHAACIDVWLKQHPTCPICRSTTKHRPNGTMPPLYYAVAVAGPPFQAPTSSSDHDALQQADPAAASATAVGTDQVDVT